MCRGGGPRFALGRGQDFVRSLMKVEDNITEGDGGLAGPGNRDFRLNGDSPAVKLGFRPIPVREIGSCPDEYRKD